MTPMPRESNLRVKPFFKKNPLIWLLKRRAEYIGSYKIVNFIIQGRGCLTVNMQYFFIHVFSPPGHRSDKLSL